MSTKTIFILAGDPSGDLHAANLARALLARDPSLSLVVMGGSQLKAVCDCLPEGRGRFLYDLASLGIVGFWEPLKRLSLWSKLLKDMEIAFRQFKPKAVLTVDFYGFNHMVLKMAKRFDVPAYYYVSPQVWASRPGRVRKLAALIRHIFLIFPFEVPLYEQAGVSCTLVGHPLLDLMPEGRPRSLEPGRPLRIGILPGSRPQEICRHLPILLEAFRLIQKEIPQAEAEVVSAPHVSKDFWDEHLAGGTIAWAYDPNYQRRAGLDFALTCSGTAALENTLLGLPMVVIYRISKISYWIIRILVRVPYITIANLMLKRPLIPELIQFRATAENVALESLRILRDPERYSRFSQELLKIRSTLGSPGVADRTAEQLLKMINSDPPALMSVWNR